MSTEFVAEKCIDKIDWGYFSAYQQVSDAFWERHSDKFREFYLNKDLQHQKTLSVTEKKEKMLSLGGYEYFEDYFMAYLQVRADGYIHSQFRTQYRVGETYTAYTNPCQIGNQSGLIVFKEISPYCHPNWKTLKAKVYYEDLSSFLYFDEAVVCSKLTVVEEI